MADLDLCGRKLGEYLLVERIGGGGGGVVYRAVALRPHREVAIKVLRQGDARARERFERESRLMARLDHPYAAHIYAFGAEREGLLWIAMEFVRGVTLYQWLRDRGGAIDLDELVPLLERVVDVVQSMHDVSIVHRDIKSTNVMLIERAGKLLPKLLDFGIAKLDRADVNDEPSLDAGYVDDEPAARPDLARTEPGTGPTTARPPFRNGPYRTRDSSTGPDVVLGSPAYMAPEQWTGGDVDHRADLYALTVIAFEALTGRRPYTAVEPEAYGPLHCTAPIPPLGGDHPASLDRLFQRALAKRPEDRFGSAVELAGAFRAELEARQHTRLRGAARSWDDAGRKADLLWHGEVLGELERWLRAGGVQLTGLETEFVAAARGLAAWGRRRSTWTRRGVAVLGVMALLGGAEYRRVLQQRASVHELAAVTGETGRQALLQGDLAEARRQLGRAHELGDHSRATEFMLARALQPRMAERGRLAASSGRMWSAVYSPDGARIVTADDKAARVWDSEAHLLFTLPHGDIVYQAIYSIDGTRIATACADGAARIWDAANGTLLHELRRHELRRDGKQLRYRKVAMSPDGHLVAAIDALGEVAHVWDAYTGATLATLENDSSETASLAFSADGRWLASSGGSDVRVFDTATWTRAITIAGPDTLALSWDPSGPRLATGTDGGDASIWAIPSGVRARHLREVGDPVSAIAFSPDGQFVAVASRSGSEQIWRAQGKLQGQLDLRHGKILSVEFDATSGLVLSATADGAAIVSDTTGIPVAVLEGPDRLLMVARFDPGARRVVGASWDGTARIWDATPSYRLRSQPDQAAPPRSHTSPDGRRLITLGPDEAPPVLWDVEHSRIVARLEGHAGRVWSARFVRDGREVLTAGGDGTVRLWDAATGQLRQVYWGDGNRYLADAALAPDGLVVVGGGSGGLLQFWDAVTGRRIWTLQAHGSAIASVDFDGGELVTRAAGGVARWSLPSPAQAFGACAALRACGIVGP